MPEFPEGFEKKADIDTRRKGQEKYLARDYLLALWKWVPDQTLQSSWKFNVRMHEIYYAFCQLCEVDGKWNIRDSFHDTLYEHMCYPWQKPLHDVEGKAWALKMAAAGLQLPYFVEDEEISNMEVHFQKVKDVFQEVSKGKVLLQAHKDAFDEARKVTIFKPQQASKSKQ
jgi:hypothetical protein